MSQRQSIILTPLDERVSSYLFELTVVDRSRALRSPLGLAVRADNILHADERLPELGQAFRPVAVRGQQLNPVSAGNVSLKQALVQQRAMLGQLIKYVADSSSPFTPGNQHTNFDIQPVFLRLGFRSRSEAEVDSLVFKLAEVFTVGLINKHL